MSKKSGCGPIAWIVVAVIAIPLLLSLVFAIYFVSQHLNIKAEDASDVSAPASSASISSDDMSSAGSAAS